MKIKSALVPREGHNPSLRMGILLIKAWANLHPIPLHNEFITSALITLGVENEPSVSDRGKGDDE